MKTDVDGRNRNNSNNNNKANTITSVFVVGGNNATTNPTNKVEPARVKKGEGEEDERKKLSKRNSAALVVNPAPRFASVALDEEWKENPLRKLVGEQRDLDRFRGTSLRHHHAISRPKRPKWLGQPN